MSEGLTFRAPSVEELQPHFTQFRINKCVAVGGMGAVYQAVQVSLDRPVAFKILPPEMAGDEKFRERFAMEAKVMARLSHPNVVQLYDYGEDGGIVWMAQEWIEGRTVEHVLHSEGAMDPMEAAAMVAQTCEGLGYAHAQGVVHRDVKPANLMEDNEGKVKVMDFGLARRTRDGGEALKSQEGGRFATTEYAAPEIWDLKREPDHRADIFSLGVLLFEALTGERPGATFRRPSEVRAGLDARFDEIVVRSLQRKPESRFQSCGEFMEALRQVVTMKAPAKGQILVGGGNTAKVTLVAPMAGARPTTSPLALNSNGGPGGKKWLGVATAAVVVLGLGGWLIASKKEEGAEVPTPPPVTEVAQPKPKPNNGTKPKESRFERMEREKRQERERLARVEKERMGKERQDAAHNDPDGGQPTKEEGVLGKLKLLDDELRAVTSTAQPVYRKAWTEREVGYLVSCAEYQEAAKKAGDLDGVLLWRDEGEFVERHGEPSADDENIPEKALAMRKAWRKELDPLKDHLEQARSGYLENCKGLSAELGEDADEEERKTLARRAGALEHFPNFLKLCEGTGPPFSWEWRKEQVREEGELPANLQAAYAELSKRMEPLERRSDKRGMSAQIIAYGRLLVTEEKALVQKGEIANAVAVRAMKDEMLAKLKGLSDDGGGVPGPVVAKKESLELISRGGVTEHCEWDRKQWRRRGSAIENEVEWARLKSRKGIGPGDFEVKLRMQLKVIGATKLYVSIGETGISLDGDNGTVMIEPGGASEREKKGLKLGACAEAGKFFDCVVERKGTAFKVIINGKEAVAAEVHERELGPISVYSGKGTLQVETISVEGALMDVTSYETLAKNGQPRANTGLTQLVRTEGDGLLAIFTEWGGEGNKSDIWACRSKDGGEKWDEVSSIASLENLKWQTAKSFSAASTPGDNVVWLAYAVGEANQKIYVRESKTGGRSWSREVEITAKAKEAGENVRFVSQGLVLGRKSPEEGRILLPMILGEEGSRRLYLLSSDDGRKWNRLGPLMEGVERGAEIVEDDQGKVWVATGRKRGNQDVQYRQFVVSEDGGETWSEPNATSVPDSGETRGGMALGEDGEGKPVWYYVNVDGPQHKGAAAKTNLTLYGSRDGGATWHELRRFHYGRGQFPCVVSLGPGRCGVFYRRERNGWGSFQARFQVLTNLWGKK